MMGVPRSHHLCPPFPTPFLCSSVLCPRLNSRPSPGHFPGPHASPSGGRCLWAGSAGHHVFARMFVNTQIGGLLRSTWMLAGCVDIDIRLAAGNGTCVSTDPICPNTQNLPLLGLISLSPVSDLRGDSWGSPCLNS